MAVTTYRYLFADLLTNTIYAELPLTNVQYGSNLNSAGTFSGEILATDTLEDILDIETWTIPGRTALYIDRNGTLVWGGIIWARSYNSTSQKFTFSGREFESYFEHRRIILDKYFTIGTDQLAVVQTLFKDAQGQTTGNEVFTNPGNIGVIVGTETSGQTLTANYPIYGYERRPILDAVRELSAQAKPYGFDFNIFVSYVSNVPTKSLKLDYPQTGTTWTASLQSAPVLELPGNMVEYEYPEDGNNITNTMYAYGAGSPPGQYISTQTDSAQIAAGWPLTENSVSYSNIINTQIVDSMALSLINAQSQPITVIKITWDANVSPEMGTFNIGDQFRIRIKDSRFPTGLDIVRRLSSYVVHAGENGPERITGSFIVPLT